MCRRVGADFERIDFKSPDWFAEYTWTLSQEEDYKKWFVEYLKSNAEARENLMEIKSTNPRFLEGCAREFVFDYGWKYAGV